MKATGRMVAVSALGALLAGPATAQGAEQVFDPSQFFIEGVRAYCGDITTIVRTNAPELIRIENDYTFILNGPVFDSFSPGVRLFVYFQTCGILFYGDMTNADASAARQGAAQHWISAEDLETICDADIMLAAGWENAPDDARCDAIYDIVLQAM